ncbi:MAG: DUF6657 family protein [Thermodesulfobacteriota bacterium]
MAEIKSTMEKVLERAARMGGGPAVDLDAEEQMKDGMRLGAAWLRDEASDLAQRLAGLDGAVRRHVQRGVVQTLLRNIFLPRDAEQIRQATRAMEGLAVVGQSHGELLMVCGEMQKILDHYLQHRDQLRQQLEGQFARQMEMMEKTLAQQTGMAMKLSPAQHPKFQEEWQRLQGELNQQYGRALDQHKQLIEQRLIQMQA